ncbi:MAG: FkbM family methyltransferase [Pseudomonadota bacterium]
MSERPTRTFPAFFEHLKSLGFAPKTCIDVGAARGTPSIYEAFPKALHIVYEPLPDFHEDLAKTMAPYRHIIRKCALMDKGQSRTILRHGDLYGSSMMHSKEGASENVIEVGVSTLDRELRDKGHRSPILLKTDCQGADLMVLKGGLKVLDKIDVVIVEASFFPFWGPHHPVFFEIVKFMNDAGFVVYDLLDGLFRPLDGALGQIDVAFVKENGPLRGRPYW